MKVTSITKAIIALCVIGFTSCGDIGNCISGDGERETIDFDVANFSGVGFYESGEVIIRQGSEQKVTVTGDGNILDRLILDVDNRFLDIELERGCYKNYDLTVEITIPNLDRVSLHGSGDVEIMDFDQQKSLDLHISGSGGIKMHEFNGLESMDAHISGSGDIRISEDIDDVQNLDVHVSGSGHFSGKKLNTDNCDVKISGSSDTRVSVNDHLKVKITGSGTVYYIGNPEVDLNVTGSGKVVKLD